jgi:hypothetical protein
MQAESSLSHNWQVRTTTSLQSAVPHTRFPAQPYSDTTRQLQTFFIVLREHAHSHSTKTRTKLTAIVQCSLRIPPGKAVFGLQKRRWPRCLSLTKPISCLARVGLWMCRRSSKAVPYALGADKSMLIGHSLPGLSREIGDLWQRNTTQAFWSRQLAIASDGNP